MFSLLGILIAVIIIALLFFGAGTFFKSASNPQATSTPTSQPMLPSRYIEESYGILDTGLDALNKTKELKQNLESQNQLDINPK